MKVQEIMAKDPKCCSPETNLVQVARIMEECDCGALPVVKSGSDRTAIGIITDRDIVIRAVAKNLNPALATAGECMSDAPVTVGPESDLEEAVRLMEENQVRRIIVVDQDGKCIGLVAQAHIARYASDETTAEAVKKISQPHHEEMAT